jgi:hypothetical protein
MLVPGRAALGQQLLPTVALVSMIVATFRLTAVAAHPGGLGERCAAA